MLIRYYFLIISYTYLSLPHIICIEYILRFCADCSLVIIAFSLCNSTLRDVLLFIYLFLCLSHVQPFCNPTDCSPPGFSVHEISQARILQWVAIPFSRGSVVPFPSRQDVLTHSPPHPRQTRPSSKILLRRGTTETPLLARRSNYVFTFQGNNLFAFGL